MAAGLLCKRASVLLALWVFHPVLGLAKFEGVVSTGTANVVSLWDRGVIEEMSQRRILPPDPAQWKPEHYAKCLRIREAEALGAFSLLRSKLGTLRGFAVEHKDPSGEKKLWLTAQGYEQFRFLRSQDARAYFESKGAQARFVFYLRERHGKLLFDDAGLLTQTGEELYNRVQRGLPVFWVYPDGTVMGNMRP